MATNWAFGMVMFNGETTTIIRRNRISWSLLDGLKKKKGSFFWYANSISVVQVALTIVATIASLNYFFFHEKNMVQILTKNRAISKADGL